MNKLDRSQLLKEIKNQFPFLRSQINAEEGLLTFELKVFANYLQSQIDEQKEETVKQCFTLLDKYYTQGNKSLKLGIRDLICEEITLSDSKKTQSFLGF